MSQDDETVERVARAIYESDKGSGRLPWARLTELSRDIRRKLARAALSAMHPPELRIGGFVLRSAPNGIWIGRDGEGGEFATEHVERVIAQYYREQF